MAKKRKTKKLINQPSIASHCNDSTPINTAPTNQKIDDGIQPPYTLQQSLSHYDDNYCEIQRAVYSQGKGVIGAFVMLLISLLSLYTTIQADFSWLWFAIMLLTPVCFVYTFLYFYYLATIPTLQPIILCRATQKIYIYTHKQKMLADVTEHQIISEDWAEIKLFHRTYEIIERTPVSPNNTLRISQKTPKDVHQIMYYKNMPYGAKYYVLWETETSYGIRSRKITTDANNFILWCNAYMNYQDEKLSIPTKQLPSSVTWPKEIQSQLPKIE